MASRNEIAQTLDCPRLLLALDCDGTLLDEAGTIRPRVRDAVRAAAEAGSLVTLATGRRLQAARGLAEALGVRTPLVLHDGAVVQDPYTGSVLYQDPLPPELVTTFVDLALDHALHPVVFRITADVGGDTIHVLEATDQDPLVAAYLAARFPIAWGDRGAMLAAAPVVRVAAMGAEEPARRLYTHIHERAPELCCVVYLHSPSGYAQFPCYSVIVTNGGCSKASAVVALAAQHGLTLADCVAVGDDINDIELLRRVREAGGVSIAMGHALESVRAVAQHVVATNDEDGAAEAIERYVLPALAGAPCAS